MAGEHVARHLSSRVSDALAGFRVVVLHGARQSGKTTLVRHIAERTGGTYLTLEDEPILQAVMDDPITLLTGWPTPLVVDEVQLAGDRLIKAVKRLVDTEQTPGRFLLTGSTNFLSVPTISESLAGRARLMRLTPLSQAEIGGAAAPPIERWLNQAGQKNPAAPPRHSAAACTPRIRPVDVHRRISRGAAAGRVTCGPDGSRAMSRPSSNATSQPSPTSDG